MQVMGENEHELLQSKWEQSVLRQAQRSSILHTEFELLPSGRRYRVPPPHCKLNRVKNSFVPTSIQLLNKAAWGWSDCAMFFYGVGLLLWLTQLVLFCFTVTWKHSCAQNLKSKTNLVMDDKVYRIVYRVSYRNTHSIYYRVISYTTLFDSYPLSCENRLFVWLYCECAVYSVCVYPCTSARLLGSLMDVTCLHNPPESRATGQWQSHSMNQWADVAKADKVLTAGLKDTQGSLKNTHTLHQTSGTTGMSEQANKYTSSLWLSRQILRIAFLPQVQQVVLSAACSLWIWPQH